MTRMNPVPTYGGNVCCQPGIAGGVDGSAQDGGAAGYPRLHDRAAQGGDGGERADHGHALRLVGPQGHGFHGQADRRVSRRRAYNLDETIQRVRYREGYDKPVWMEPGKVYKVTCRPMNTSNYFEAGHRIRIEVSSSNFPRFDRNLNTGGHNYDETTGARRAQRGAPLEAVSVGRDDHSRPPQARSGGHDGRGELTPCARRRRSRCCSLVCSRRGRPSPAPPRPHGGGRGQ